MWAPGPGSVLKQTSRYWTITGTIWEGVVDCVDAEDVRYNAGTAVTATPEYHYPG